jgi:DnaJ family protein C protein 7
MLQLLKTDQANVEACTVRAQALYLSGDFEAALKHLREALRLNPDFLEAQRTFKRARKVKEVVECGRAAAHCREFEKACELFGEALGTLDTERHGAATGTVPLSVELLCEQAHAYLRLKDYTNCLAACENALHHQRECRKATFTKAQALQNLGRHNEALEGLNHLYQLHPGDSTIQAAYEKCKFEIRKLARPDYYELLGVPKVASVVEIKTAYKQRAKELHPDKHADKSVAEVAEFEKQFKLMGDALDVLGDPMKRQLWDEGYDKEAIEERVSRAQRAARENPQHGHRH